MDLVLTIDTQNRKLVTGPQNSLPFVFPPLMQGDTVRLVLQGVKPNPTPSSAAPYVDDPITFTGIKAGIGPGPDAVAQAGTFTIGLVGQTEAAGPFPYNIAQATVLSALNDLASVQAVSEQGVTLDVQTPNATNFFFIRWVDSTKTAQFEYKSNLLEPMCFTRSIVYALPGGQLQILKAIVAPVAFTDQFAYPANDPVATASVRVGSATLNCIQSVTIPTDATGSFYLTFASNGSALMPCSALQGNADASSTLAAALNGIYADSQTRFSVTYQDIGKYYVEFVGPLAKTDYPILGVTMVDQETSTTPVAYIPLTGPALEVALHGQAYITQIFELEITNADGVVTPVQQAITVKNDMIDSAMAIVADPAWLAQVDPTSVPYNPATGAAITGYRSYVIGLGSGVANGSTNGSFVVTHNLGTPNCHVTVREAIGPLLRIPDSQYVCTFLNDNQVQIDFVNVPNYSWDTLPMDGQFEVVISSAIAQDMAFPNLTVNISQVTGLQTILNQLLAGINPDAPISAADLPAQLPWYNYDSGGNQTSLKFAPLPDALLPPDVATLPLTQGEMPAGTPYVGTDGGLYVDLPGSPPSTVEILDPTGHLPVAALPTDPTQWRGLAGAILNILQGGALVPKGLIPIAINPLKNSFPADVVLRPGETAVPASLARALPAAVDGGAVTGALPAPSSILAGKTFTVGVGGASAAAARYRAPQSFAPGALVGCDGFQYYPVFKDGADAFPREMETNLFTIHVAPNMLVAGTQFAANATIQLGLTGPCASYVRAAYILRVRFGHTTGPFLSSVVWDSDPIAQQLILSSATVYHTFGVTVASANTSGALSAAASWYGRSAVVTAPAGADFVVAAYLTKFDIEDVGGIAVGQVSLNMPAAVASIANLTS